MSIDDIRGRLLADYAQTATPATDAINDVRDLLAEVDQLQSSLTFEREAHRATMDRAKDSERWKEEAMPVMDGLQELGRALDIPLGARITGTDALAAVEALKADRDAYRRDCDRLREEVRRARVTAAQIRLGQGVTEK